VSGFSALFGSCLVALAAVSLESGFDGWLRIRFIESKFETTEKMFKGPAFSSHLHSPSYFGKWHKK
jgi:hypothetical protein